MQKLIFANQISSTYFLGKGRGKDKKKRKSRLGYLIGSGLGAATLGGIAKARRGYPLGAALVGSGLGLIAGRTINKNINKEKERYQKEGYRTRLGKITTDARTGAKSLGAVIVPITTIGAGALGLKQGIMTGSLKGMLSTGAKVASLGLGPGVLGSAVVGGGTGALVGAGRSLIQPNKKKRKKLKVSINYD